MAKCDYCGTTILFGGENLVRALIAGQLIEEQQKNGTSPKHGVRRSFRCALFAPLMLGLTVV